MDLFGGHIWPPALSMSSLGLNIRSSNSFQRLLQCPGRPGKSRREVLPFPSLGWEGGVAKWGSEGTWPCSPSLRGHSLRDNYFSGCPCAAL